MEYRGMRGIEFVSSEHTTRRCDVERNAMRQQSSNLIRGCLRTQNHIGSDKTCGVLGLVSFDVKRVLHLTGGVIRTEVQSVKVVPLAFHFGAFGNLPTHGNKEVFDIFQ